MKKFWMGLAIFALASSGLAAEKKDKVAESEDIVQKGVVTTFSAGLTLTDGNSETLAANAALKTEGDKEGLGSVLAGVEANYGESTVDEVEDTTVENAKVFANVKKTLSPRTFGYLDASVLYDDVALIDYRATVGPGLGAYLIKNDKRTLSLEAGPSYVWEQVDGASDDYLALRFAERYTCQISATAKIVQSLEYMPAADDFDDYLLNGEIGVEAAMTERVSLKLVLQDKYDSTPATETEYNDLSLIAGLGFAL